MFLDHVEEIGGSNSDYVSDDGRHETHAVANMDHIIEKVDEKISNAKSEVI